MKVRVFKSHKEADLLKYANMSPSEKLAMIEQLRMEVIRSNPAYMEAMKLPRHLWPVKIIRRDQQD